MVAVCAGLVVSSPLLASGQDVIRDYESGAQGTGTIDRCYPPEDFNDALRIARADRAQYGAAVDAIRAKQAECQGTRATTTPVDVSEDDGGLSPLVIIGAVLLVAVAAGAAFLARNRRREDQFDDQDPTPPTDDRA